MGQPRHGTPHTLPHPIRFGIGEIVYLDARHSAGLGGHRVAVPVYGLNCPCSKTRDISPSSEFLVQLHMEIQRRSPTGLCNLGGWSTGGICAYEAALLLTNAGHQVDRFFFRLSLSIGRGKLPPCLHDFLDSQNVFCSDNPFGALSRLQPGS